MAFAAADNHWELAIEREVPLKRTAAYRVMILRIAEWWWHPSSHPVSEVVVNWRANGVFQVKANGSTNLQEGIILEQRNGWHFFMTDALRYAGRPGKPSMVGYWSVETVTPGISKHSVRIRHFSEADYRRSVDLGFERGWNEAADRFVKLCEQGDRPR